MGKYGEQPQGATIVEEDRNVLISLVKKDNEKVFLDGSATIYYTGKKFPTSVALNKLFYFMPYIKGKGVRDLFLLRQHGWVTARKVQQKKTRMTFVWFLMCSL